MYREGTLLRFEPFRFKNGAQEKPKLNAMNTKVINLGVIKPEIFASVIECLKNSKTIKRRYRKLRLNIKNHV